MMDAKAWIGLIHPVITVIFVFPLIGIVINFAWQTRQRRLAIAAGAKSTIPPIVGREHVKIGRWLAGGVVGVSLLGIVYSIFFKSILASRLLATNPFQVVFLGLMLVLTIAAFVLLYKAREKHWRGIFATLSSMGLIILGCQEGIFRRTNEWYWSHYYFGVTASLLMIISVTILPEIYQDQTSSNWRKVHIILNTIALLLFIGQGFTGARDLYEIGFYAKH